jgi:DNA-binding response OmpR family regulator
MVHISNIRRKIDIDNNKPSFIQTVKGAGYRFKTPTFNK